jgi:hypothetical protein
MQLYGIKSVYYSNEDGEIIKEKIIDISADHMSISQNKYYEYIKNGDKNVLEHKEKTKKK